MEYLELLIIFLLSLTGAVIARWLKSSNPIYLKLMIAFTGGFLLTVCLVHLLPEVYGAGLPDVAGFVLAGFIIQILLDQMSAGLEHGHVHIHNNSVWTPWIIITGLFLHALLEGIPLGGHSHESGHESHDLLLAIALHKLPEGIALGFLLIQLKKPIWLNITLMISFALMTPIGSLLTSSLPVAMLVEWSPRLLALVIGLFLHLSTTILFEAGSEHHKVSGRRISAIMAGIIIAYLLH